MAAHTNAILMKAFNSIGAEGFGRLITRGFTGTKTEDFLKFVKELPWVFQMLIIFAIQNEGTAFDLAAAGVESIIELSRFNPLLKVAAEGTIEGLVEGLPAFISANKGDRDRKAFKNYLVDEIRQGRSTEDTTVRYSKKQNAHLAGEAGVREDGRIHWIYNPKCDAQKSKITADGSWKEIKLAHGDKAVCRACFPEAYLSAALTAGQVTVEQIVAPLPPGAPNWINEVDEDKRSALLGLYMAALDHTTYDADESQKRKTPIGFAVKSRTNDPSKTEEVSSRKTNMTTVAVATLVAIFAFIGLTALFTNGLVALSFLGIASLTVLTAAIANTISMVWRITNFKDASVNPRHKFENLDGLAFRLKHGLEWMAKNRPADLNKLLKSNLSFEEARTRATEEFSEIVPAVLLTTRGVDGIPWYVPVQDMADVAVQIPALRHFLHLAFINGGKFAARGVMLFMAFVLLPLIIVYGGTLITTVFLLINGIAGFFHAFGVTEHYSILETAMTLVGQSSYDPTPSQTVAGYNEVPLLGLVVAAAQIWIFRFMIVALVAPVEIALIGGAQPKISRHSGKEHLLIMILRSVNNRLPKTMCLQIDPPMVLTAEELLDLKRMTGNPRVKQLALIIILIAAVATFLGSSYNVLTGQYVLANVMLCFVLLIAILAEVTAMLSYLMGTERKVEQSKMIQNVLFGLVILAGLALLLVGTGTVASVMTYGASSYIASTRAYQYASDSLDSWIADDEQVADPVQTPRTKATTPKAKPTSTKQSQQVKPKTDIDKAACKRFPDLCK